MANIEQREFMNNEFGGVIMILSMQLRLTLIILKFSVPVSTIRKETEYLKILFTHNRANTKDTFFPKTSLNPFSYLTFYVDTIVHFSYLISCPNAINKLVAKKRYRT